MVKQYLHPGLGSFSLGRARFLVQHALAPGLSEADEHSGDLQKASFFFERLLRAQASLDLGQVQASGALESRANGIIQCPGFVRTRPKACPFGDIEYHALGSPAEVLNDGVSPTPGRRQAVGAGAEDQRFLETFSV